MSGPTQGEVWWAEAEDQRRPVLVCTRSEAIPVLTAIVVAPVTRSVRGIPTEVPLGRDEGLEVESAASFDNLQTIPRGALTTRLGTLDPLRKGELGEALRAMSDSAKLPPRGKDLHAHRGHSLRSGRREHARASGFDDHRDGLKPAVLVSHEGPGLTGMPRPWSRNSPEWDNRLCP